MRVYRRSKGDVLQPTRFTPAVVTGFKQKPREWSGQYQQLPNPSTGIIFNPNHWKFYRSRDPLPEFDIVALSIDCAFKSAADNDFVAIQKWGGIGPRSYLLSYQKEHLGYAATKASIKAMNNEGLRASVILIEDRANGSAVIEELRSDDFFGASVIAIEPEGGKESRAYAASADAEAGNVYLPEDAPWLAGFLRTAAAFPRVAHDDDIDSLTQFLNWRRLRSQGILGVIENLKRIAAGGKDALEKLFARKPGEKPSVQVAITTKTGPPETRAAGGPPVDTTKPDKCPACGFMTIIQGAGAPVGYFFCNQCHAVFDSQGDILSARGQTETCAASNTGLHIWRKIPGQQLKCDACGLQRWDGTPANTMGMSRAQWARQRTIYGQYDRPNRLL